MKKLLTLLFILFLSFAQAKSLNSSIMSHSYKDAKSKKNQLKFTVESTKVGIFSSDVDGYVKDFSYQAEFDETNLIIRNMTVNFKVTSMDTDGESRDDKLHNLCMSQDKYPVVSIKILGALFLKDARTQKLQGTVNIRGKNKSFEIEFFKETKNNVLSLVGKTTWSLKEMEIPDPSIAVAKLSDEIKIEVRINSKLN